MNPLVRIYSRVKSLRETIYLNWIRKQFADFGEGSFVSKISNLSNPQCVSVGKNVFIGANSVIDAITVHGEDSFTPEITIGDNSRLGDYCHLGAIRHIHIGSGVLVGRFVLIIDHSHGTADDVDSSIPPFRRRLTSKGGITVGDNVWIGDKATILSGVTIGEGAIIGANSVVTKDVPPHSVVAGCPAVVIKK